MASALIFIMPSRKIHHGPLAFLRLALRVLNCFRTPYLSFLIVRGWFFFRPFYFLFVGTRAFQVRWP